VEISYIDMQQRLDLPEFALSAIAEVNDLNTEDRSQTHGDRYLDRMLTIPPQSRSPRRGKKAVRSKLRSSIASVCWLVVMAIGILAIGVSIHWGLKLVAVDVSRDVVCAIVGILYLRK
jgi:hypothetical protein